jgi:mono/diheme cytochrome c family protein
MAQARRLRPLWYALAGAAAVLALQAAAGLVYLGIGGFNVAASIPHDRLSYGLTHEMMVRSVRRRAPKVRPPPVTPDSVRAGFGIYAARCAECHGAPAIDVRARWVDGMTPSPPYIVDAARDWTPGELFWIVKHGAKMTGMPAWGRLCSDAEIWDVVAFLEALAKAPAGRYRDLAQSQPGAGPAPPSARGCAG